MSSDGDDGGGTFWTTFGGAAGTQEVTPLERLLQNSDCQVEALLDEEDVIQEFKACNERLVARLCKPDATKAFIDFITCEPPDGGTVARCFRYPFVAVELMTCGADKFFQVLNNPDHPELFDAFWGFLDSTPPMEVNPVLAGYFARTAASLLGKHHEQVVKHLQTRGTDDLLDRFLERLHLRSLAELLARLLCAEQQSQLVFPIEGLAERLLAQLSGDEHSPSGAAALDDRRENVALIMSELLARKDPLCFSDKLLRQLMSPQAIGMLVQQVFSERPGAVSSASAILSSVVFHAYVAPQGVNGVLPCTPTLTPLSAPALSLTGDDDLVNVGLDDPIEGVGEAALATRSSGSSPPRSPSTACRPEITPTPVPECRTAALMREVCSHIPRVRGILEAALSRSPETPPPAHLCATNSVGSTTLGVVDLLTMLVKTGSDAVLEAILREQLLNRCMDLFFRHPWSSLLHNAVKSLVEEVMNSTDGVRPKIILGWLCEGGFGSRLVAEYGAEWERQASGVTHRGPRVGYMGHLYTLCKQALAYGARVPEVAAAIDSVSGWADVVIPALDLTSSVHDEELGGGVENRGLASSNANAATPDSAHSNDQAEFQLDSLAEPFEDELNVISGGDEERTSSFPSMGRFAAQPPPVMPVMPSAGLGDDDDDDDEFGPPIPMPPRSPVPSNIDGGDDFNPSTRGDDFNPSVRDDDFIPSGCAMGGAFGDAAAGSAVSGFDTDSSWASFDSVPAPSSPMEEFANFGEDPFKEAPAAPAETSTDTFGAPTANKPQPPVASAATPPPPSSPAPGRAPPAPPAQPPSVPAAPEAQQASEPPASPAPQTAPAAPATSPDSTAPVAPTAPSALTAIASLAAPEAPAVPAAAAASAAPVALSTPLAQTVPMAPGTASTASAAPTAPAPSAAYSAPAVPAAVTPPVPSTAPPALAAPAGTAVPAPSPALRAPAQPPTPDPDLLRAFGGGPLALDSNSSSDSSPTAGNVGGSATASSTSSGGAGNASSRPNTSTAETADVPSMQPWSASFEDAAWPSAPSATASASLPSTAPSTATTAQTQESKPSLQRRGTGIEGLAAPPSNDSWAADFERGFQFEAPSQQPAKPFVNDLFGLLGQDAAQRPNAPEMTRPAANCFFAAPATAKASVPASSPALPSSAAYGTQGSPTSSQDRSWVADFDPLFQAPASAVAPSSGFGAAPSTGFGAAPSTGFGAAPSTGFGVAPSTGFGAAPSTGFEAAPSTGFGAFGSNSATSGSTDGDRGGGSGSMQFATDWPQAPTAKATGASGSQQQSAQHFDLGSLWPSQ